MYGCLISLSPYWKSHQKRKQIYALLHFTKSLWKTTVSLPRSPQRSPYPNDSCLKNAQGNPVYHVRAYVQCEVHLPLQLPVLVEPPIQQTCDKAGQGKTHSSLHCPTKQQGWELPD